MYWKPLDDLARAVMAFSAVALVLLVVFTGWQVRGRYVPNDTPTSTEKAALLLILMGGLIGCLWLKHLVSATRCEHRGVRLWPADGGALRWVWRSF